MLSRPLFAALAIALIVADVSAIAWSRNDRKTGRTKTTIVQNPVPGPGKPEEPARHRCGCMKRHAGEGKKIVELELFAQNITQIGAYNHFTRSLRNPIQQSNQLYMANIHLGSPPQAVPMIFSTMLDTAWVPEKGCRSAGLQNTVCNHRSPTYDASSSSTSKRTHQRTYFGTLRLNFELGHASGEIASDNLQLQGRDGRHQIAFRRPVRFSLLNDFSNGDHAVFGLGLSPYASFSQWGSEPMSTPDIFRTNELARPIAQLFYRDCRGGCVGNKAGVVTMGGTNGHFCAEPKNWYSVSEPRRAGWNLRFKEVRMGGSRMTGVLTTLSSFTPSLIMSKRAARKFAAAVGARKAGDDFLISCSKPVEMKLTTETGEVLTIPDRLLKQRLQGDECRLEITFSKDQQAFDYWIMGGPLMRAYCWTLDYEKKQMSPSEVTDHEANQSMGQSRQHRPSAPRLIHERIVNPHNYNGNRRSYNNRRGY